MNRGQRHNPSPLSGLTPAILALQEVVEVRLRHGGSIEDVDAEIIEPSTLNSDQKAAPWLYAWS